MSRLLALLIATVALAGCEPLDRLSRVEVVAKSETTVNGCTPCTTLDPLGFDEFASFNINSSSSFQNSDASKDNIGEDSFVTEFTIRVLDPDDQTLEFIDSMRVFMDDDDNPNNGETEVAFIGSGQSTDVKELSLRVNDERAIGQYLRADETVIRVNAEGNPPPQDTTLEAEMHLDVDLVW